MNKIKNLILILIIGLFLNGCGTSAAGSDTDLSFQKSAAIYQSVYTSHNNKKTVDTYPVYTGKASIIINRNIPFFTSNEITTKDYEKYSDLDELGRTGVATACLGTKTMPAKDEKREEINMVKPSGWHTVKYPEIIKDRYLYNRCHLIGWQLSGENANEKNLITGTRYLNIEGMLPFENEVAEYIRKTNNHVMYRVSPIYTDKNLICNGVLMEAKSVENNKLSFCIYCYNIQPGIKINYVTGSSEITKTNDSAKTNASDVIATEKQYILNTNSMKIHLPDCPAAKKISEKNKQAYTGNIETLIQKGYTPCQYCHPEK